MAQFIGAARGAGVMAAGGCVLASVALGQTSPVYPEGVDVPRHATAAERAWMDANPWSRVASSGGGTGLNKNVTNGAPTGVVVGPGEYAPCEAIIMAWEGGATLNNIQRQMIREITTTGNADVYLVFDDAGERDSVMPTLSTNSLSVGTNVARVRPVVTPTNTIWLRDYGPRYVYENRVRVISDHTYNVTSRTSDNAMPVPFGAFKRHAVYTLPLLHGGGNYHLNSTGLGFATQLITNENPSRTAAQIQQLWQQHWGVSTTITGALATSVDGTQHIDMWMQIIGDRRVVISDFVAQSGTAQDNLMELWATTLASQGWTVTRTPARNLPVGGFNTHYTYTNVVMCNNLVLIPSYTNATITQYNAPALAAWQAALPNHTVVAINSEALAQLSGVMHCIVMHMPKHLGEAVAGGLAPTAFLRTQRASANLIPGATVPVRFISDDDQRVTGATIQASTNGGLNWNLTLGTIPEAGVYAGTFNWTVPNIPTSELRVRVVVSDPDGRTGFDAPPVDLTIAGEPCIGDTASPGQVPARDGELTADDVIVFIARFTALDPAADIAGPGQSVGGDNEFTADDVLLFVNRFTAGC
jgi:agmatine/peptidylarginine deiminase